LLLTLLGLAAAAAPPVCVVTAHEPAASPAEQQIRYRMALYTVMAGNAGPIFAMSDGKLPYDAAAAVKRAERVSFIAGILPEAFPVGSNVGADTEALPDIWKNRADFDRLMKNLGDKAAALVTAARTNDLKQLQAASGALAKTCKACHDKYRKKEH
jgi:cytochrome c556